MPDRVADYPIDNVFLERWSPRAFTGESIPETELFTLFEAARWAPSAYNSQPWRFIWARRDTPQWQPFLDILIEFNRSWVKNAAAIVFMISKSTMLPPGKDREVPSHSHSFDAGAAWGALGLQAVKSGWATHGMVGLDFEKAFADLELVEGWRVEAAVAIGRQGDKSTLPDALQARETPSPRLSLKVTAMEGKFRPE